MYGIDLDDDEEAYDVEPEAEENIVSNIKSVGQSVEPIWQETMFFFIFFRIIKCIVRVRTLLILSPSPLVQNHTLSSHP